ncbi:EscU/YscU/HrcU family type III secretion system export apparatus switch protein [Pengzhenrongella sicca]|uniref:EscU/YscU/HrcU family type III secretion system export apparatus switch protein n=1 Tax=Pengzhenrongella sicca TaxID=2819238 RepID=A0A8A4ZF08_9MICO|nr:EscU/YscU/HrcU family type III secretion system export apparatus switch protein [Pengzhenrongella sicca]QTE29885.1 EscU/YscU/HrcU family type III secretion system export apparatus switch protein [Pengzhenrongella sicca]
MSGGDSGSKSHKATPKRMKQLRHDGSLQKSQDLSAWLGMGAAALTLPGLITAGTAAAVEQLQVVRTVIATPDPALAVQALFDASWTILPTLGALLAVVVVTAIVATAAQGGIFFSTKKLKPTFKQFNPVAGLKRILGMQAWWQGLKALLKTIVVGWVLYVTVVKITPMLLSSGGLPLTAVLVLATDGVSGLMRSAVAAGLVLAVFDILVIRKTNRKQTMMSTEEIKQEHKSSEGDPLLKGAIRSKQMAMSRNRMMAGIATADVVLVNPTHVAVALKYEPGKGAPRVIAKGSGHVAARIRAEATKQRVPMIADVALARALNATCKLGEEVPADLFVQVAKILAFVMSLRRRGSAQGIHTVPTQPVRPAHPTRTSR